MTKWKNTVDKEALLVDWNEIESKHVRCESSWQLQCPKCKEWFKQLLTTIFGTMCKGCLRNNSSAKRVKLEN